MHGAFGSGGALASTLWDEYFACLTSCTCIVAACVSTHELNAMFFVCASHLSCAAGPVVPPALGFVSDGNERPPAHLVVGRLWIRLQERWGRGMLMTLASQDRRTDILSFHNVRIVGHGEGPISVHRSCIAVLHSLPHWADAPVSG